LPSAVPDDQALFQAILADPEDDLPRLIYADWCEENGDTDRAEFIRVQIEIARLPELAGGSRAAELRRREQELWRQHGATWRQVVPPCLRSGVVFRRGFIDEFSGSARAFFQQDESAFWRVAPARTLYLTGGPRDPLLDCRRDLASSPFLDRLDKLELNRIGLYLSEVRTLLRARRLRTLNLVRCFVRIDSANLSLPALMCQAHFHVDDIVAGALAEVAELRRLAHFRLAGCLDDDGARALAASPHLAGLATLDLEGNCIGPAGAAALRRRFGTRLRLGQQLDSCGY
jgi:uncharacterized protein (TIGR02996 family)